jgi:hypothetical protein
MLLALGPVALIPVKSGYPHPGLSRQPLLSVDFVQPLVNIFGCTDFRKVNAFNAHWRPTSYENLLRRDDRQAGPVGLLGESREFTATNGL